MAIHKVTPRDNWTPNQVALLVILFLFTVYTGCGGHLQPIH